MANTRRAVGNVLARARQSLKILESLDKDSIMRARSFVRHPITGSEEFVAQLKKLGLATWDELYAELEALRGRDPRTPAPTDPASKPEAPLPNG